MKYRDWLKARERLMTTESLQPPRTWYLSFAGESGFRGGCVIRACGFGHAVEAAHRAGVNPGGEVVGIKFLEDVQVPEKYMNRLLSKADLDELSALVEFDEWKN